MIAATIDGTRIVVVHVTTLAELTINSVNQNVREVAYVLKVTRNPDYWAFVCRLCHHYVNGTDFGETESRDSSILITTHFRDLSTKN